MRTLILEPGKEVAMGTKETPHKIGLPQIVKLDMGLKLVTIPYFWNLNNEQAMLLIT